MMGSTVHLIFETDIGTMVSELCDSQSSGIHVNDIQIQLHTLNLCCKLKPGNFLLSHDP